MAFEKVETWTGLDDLAKRMGVHKALVMVDSGDNTQVVYAECCRRGWKCSKGSGNEDFAITSSDGRTTRRFYSDPQAIVVPGQPTRASLVVFSAMAAKDLLHGLRTRKLHTYPRDASEDYAKQLNSGRRSGGHGNRRGCTQCLTSTANPSPSTQACRGFVGTLNGLEVRIVGPRHAHHLPARQV